MIRIIDNKKVDLTDDEYTLYQNIVKSYTSNTNKGEDLFIDLFESNDKGQIIFLRPPSKRQTSLEVYLFITSIFHHQHVRAMQEQVNDICRQMKDKINEIDKILEKLK